MFRFPTGRRAVEPMRSGILLLAALVYAANTSAITPPSRGFDVVGYSAYLIPNMSTGTLDATESIELTLTRAGVTQLEFDVGNLTIDAVSIGGTAAEFTATNKKLRIALPAKAKPGKRLRIDVRFHGSPRHGLEFHIAAEQIYTIFSTSEWLVTIDAPDERATLDLSVVLPETYRATGNGATVSRKRVGGNRVVHRWRQRSPIPSFVYGFAAGRLNEVKDTSNNIELRFLSRGLTDEQSRRLFANTHAMLALFGERAGVPYRGKYDQVLVAETIGQEVASFALLSEAYGRSTLAGETSEELIAHEVAHQWWGVSTTCHTWGEFWLNEGFATFMAAAYMQHKFGDAEYLLSVNRWRTRLDKLKADGKDHALVYDRWDKPTRDDRAVVYQKSAYVLHLLRQELGDAIFWKGIKQYSQSFANSSVTTHDFQRVMERASGRSLEDFFTRWVVAGDVTPTHLAP